MKVGLPSLATVCMDFPNLSRPYGVRSRLAWPATVE